ncbi:MAG: T9SS type A sorting domain-containing protein, partial [Ferruginibacter sp.]
NAGSDVVITLPTNSVNLSGSGIDSDGVITTYGWSKISGPTSYSISSSSSANTTVSNLVEGDYVFQLKVTDDDGASAYDEVQVTVNKAIVVAPPSGVNQIPVSNAGPDVTISLPTNSVTLVGSGTDSDGYIATYVWTKVSGVNNYAIKSPSSATTVISGLIEGRYLFQLKVIDNSGASAYDYVYVTVTKAAAPRSSNTNSTANSGTGSAISPLNFVNSTNELKVYPNPVKSITNLQLKTIIPDTKASITIVNASGLKVKYKEMVIQGGNANLPLDMSGLSDGIYIISVRLADGTILNGKVVKYGGSR